MKTEQSPLVRLDSTAPGDVVHWSDAAWLVSQPKVGTSFEMLAPEGFVLLVRLEDGMAMFANPWDLCRRNEHAVYRL